MVRLAGLGGRTEEAGEARATGDLKRGQAIAQAGLKRPLTWPLMRTSGLSLHRVLQERQDLGASQRGPKEPEN